MKKIKNKITVLSIISISFFIFLLIFDLSFAVDDKSSTQNELVHTENIKINIFDYYTQSNKVTYTTKTVKLYDMTTASNGTPNFEGYTTTEVRKFIEDGKCVFIHGRWGEEKKNSNSETPNFNTAKRKDENVAGYKWFEDDYYWVKKSKNNTYEFKIQKNQPNGFTKVEIEEEGYWELTVEKQVPSDTTQKDYTINNTTRAKYPNRTDSELFLFGQSLSTGQHNKWTGNSGGVYRGIVKDTLKNGKLQYNNEKGIYGSELFPDKGTTVTGVEGYYDVDFKFLIDDEGYYNFDSDKHTMKNLHIDSNGKAVADFSYDKALTISNGTGNSKSYGFYPFNTAAGQTPHYLFGMEMGFEFIMPKDGKIEAEDGTKKDMVFEFSGDDDVWIFVDDKLVLDLGGIHIAEAGSINFATGVVTYQRVYDEGTGKVTNNVTENLYTSLGIDKTNYKKHTFKMFYIERGLGDSNCKIKFNLPVIPTESISLTKEVAGINEVVDNDKEYEFTVYTGEDKNNLSISTGKYTLNGATKTLNNGKVKLKVGETAYFTDIPLNYYYKIVETNTNDGCKTSWKTKNISYKESRTTDSLYCDNNTDVTFKNDYSDVVKSLELEKKLDGNDEENPSYDFIVKIADKNYSGKATKTTANGTNTINVTNGKISLKADEKVKITGLLKDTDYKITEDIDLEEGAYATPVIKLNGTELGERTYITSKIEDGSNKVTFINSFASKGRVVVTKKIDEYYVHYGNPVFFFRLDKVDDNGNVQKTYRDFVEFTSDNGTQQVAFENLENGNYVLTEEQPIRYEFKSVKANGASADTSKATKANNGKVTLKLKRSDTNASVEYTNSLKNEKYFSHTDVKRNTFTIK